MKLVLAGSRSHYDRFIEVLWSKDRDVSNYRYISSESALRGVDRDNQIIRLGSFRLHPEHEHIWESAQSRFDLRSLRERRESDRGSENTADSPAFRFSDDIVASARPIQSDNTLIHVSANTTFNAQLSGRFDVSSSISSEAVLSEHTLDAARYQMEQASGVSSIYRGLVPDMVWVDETSYGENETETQASEITTDSQVDEEISQIASTVGEHFEQISQEQEGLRQEEREDRGLRGWGTSISEWANANRGVDDE